MTIADRLRRLARVAEDVRAVCDEIANTIDPLPPEIPEPGSEIAKTDELVARIYLARALTRFSPRRPPQA